MPGATDQTAGNCTINISAVPATDPHASSIASSGSAVPRPPKTTSVAIIATFQTTGAAYEIRNLWWLFSTPRHHADMTIRPTPGKRMRTMRIVRSRVAPVNPGAIKSMRSGVPSTQTSTRALTASAISENTAPATRSASLRSPFATSAAYTGMKDADSAPSPNRLLRKLGMRKPAVNASAAAESPK